MLRKKYINLSFILTLVLALSHVNIHAADVAAGENLFRANCSACHRVQGKLVGPQLAGVSAKYANDKEWLYAWVKNSQGLIAAGDEKAIALWEANNKGIMNAFPALSNEDIDNILAYVDEEAAPKEEVVVNGGNPIDAPFENPQIYYALLGLVGVLALIALLLVFITATLITAVRAKDGKEAFKLSDVIDRSKSILQNKFVLTAIILFILTAGTWQAIAVGTNVSLHKGYMPEQPIKFSHKLHAGQYEIECEYCHSGVRKGKSAWIPSTNVCMNCHKYIHKGPNYGTEEIAKIYEAAGWDPNAGEYTGEGKAVEWVRIHNNPDHAYFNHAQHVVVGNLDCERCHGPIKEMEVVYQYSILGMGWCINCHREEKVKVLGKETEMTVEDMGGLDCSRCHY